MCAALSSALSLAAPPTRCAQGALELARAGRAEGLRQRANRPPPLQLGQNDSKSVRNVNDRPLITLRPLGQMDCEGRGPQSGQKSVSQLRKPPSMPARQLACTPTHVLAGSGKAVEGQ